MESAEPAKKTLKKWEVNIRIKPLQKNDIINV